MKFNFKQLFLTLFGMVAVAAPAQAQPQQPVAAVNVGDVQVGVMPDGHVAIFRDHELIACECTGTPVVDCCLEEPLVGMKAAGREVTVLHKQEEGDSGFYTLDAKGVVVQLKQAHDCMPYHTDWPDMPTP